MTETSPPAPRQRSLESYLPFGCFLNLVLFAGFVALGVFVALRKAQDTAAYSNAFDETKQVLDSQVAAWNRGDLDGFMAEYWNHEQLFYISGGKSVQGFRALKNRYATAYQGEGKEMGKLKFSELHIEPLGPDAALVRGKWEVTTAKETVGGWFTLFFRRTPDGWKITHDHTSK